MENIYSNFMDVLLRPPNLMLNFYFCFVQSTNAHTLGSDSWILDCRFFNLSTHFFSSFFTQHSLSINLVTSLAANNYQLQNELIRNGVLWSLLLFMFDYDYTLEESGVEIEEKSNKQVRGPETLDSDEMENFPEWNLKFNSDTRRSLLTNSPYD